MVNRMLQLAAWDYALQRFSFLRWVFRITLFILLLSSLLLHGLELQPTLLGFFFFFLPAGILTDLFFLFLHQEIAKEELSEHKKKGAGVTFAAARLLVRSRRRKGFLWAVLVRDPSLRFVLQRLGVPHQFLQSVGSALPEYDPWLIAAQTLARSEQKALQPKHLFESLQSSPPFTALWQELGLTVTERADVWAWYERLESVSKQAKRTLADSLTFSGGIGRDWVSGYTHVLDQYAFDLTKQLEGLGHEITLVGHKEERQRVLEYLSRDHTHNVLLIGEEGIGKERTMYSLASEFLAGAVPLSLKYKHLYMLDTGALISARSQQELEARLRSLLGEASTVGNVVLIIPDFHLLVGGQTSEVGAIDASAVLTSYLKSPSIQVIAMITPPAYYAHVKPNASLDPYLLAVEIKEINSLEALTVLQDEVFRYERKSNHVFTYQALIKVIQIADRHVHTQPYPEKALALLDEVAGAVSSEAPGMVTGHEVERILGLKLKVPMGNVAGQERDVLNNLEQLIQSRIVGQKEAVSAVANALRRARAGLHSGKRPIGSFLFLGPTGVGKTEMAKTIAALYYKNEKAFIRLDMSEYQTPESISKLIGTATSPGALTTAVTDQPFSVILLDEIEKAAPSVRNVFLQILDDGRVTDGYGKVVDFTNAMVIATSNAGAQFIRDAVTANTVDATFKARLLDFVQAQGIYSPEWLNRFDAVVVFLPLSQEEILAVAKLQVTELINRLRSHDINLTITDDVYDVLVQRGYDPQFGARPMRRAVQDSIETALAQSLINDTNEGTKTITLTASQLK